MSNVIVHRHAAEYLKRLPKETKDRIKDILKQLENSPLNHSGIKQMFGEWAGPQNTSGKAEDFKALIRAASTSGTRLP
jgi:hypothetical protein